MDRRNQLALKYYKDSRRFTGFWWRYFTMNQVLPRWLRDEADGIADESLEEATRKYEDRGADLKTYLFLVCKRRVNNLRVWAYRKKRGVFERRIPDTFDASCFDPSDERTDEMVGMWKMAVAVDAEVVERRFGQGEPLTTNRDKLRMRSVLRTVRKEFQNGDL